MSSHDHPELAASDQSASSTGTASKQLVAMLVGVTAIEGVIIAALALGYVTKVITMQVFILGVVLASGLAMPAILLVAVKIKKAKQAELVRALDTSGIDAIDTRDAPARARHFEAFARVKELRSGAKRVTAGGTVTVDTREVRLIRHQYTVSSGNSSQTITHTCAAVQVPTGWPAIRLSGEHIGHTIAAWFGKRDAQLEHEPFNKSWHIDADESAKDFALLMLTPELQQWLTPRDASESWVLGGGWLVCVRRKTLKPEEWRVFAERPVEFLARVPVELDAYV